MIIVLIFKWIKDMFNPFEDGYSWIINPIFNSFEDRFQLHELNLGWFEHIINSFKDRFHLILSIFKSIKVRFNSFKIGINK